MAMMRPLRTKTPAPIMFPTANATAAERLNPFDRFAPPGIGVYVRQAGDKAAGRGFALCRPRTFAGDDCRLRAETRARALRDGALSGTYVSEKNRSPTIPATIRTMQRRRMTLRDSPKRMIPAMTVPTAPMPVYTAYAVPRGRLVSDRERR